MCRTAVEEDQGSADLSHACEPLSSVGQSSLIDVKNCNLRPVWLDIRLVKEFPACTSTITASRCAALQSHFCVCSAASWM